MQDDKKINLCINKDVVRCSKPFLLLRCCLHFRPVFALSILFSDHDMSRSPILDTTHTRRLLAGEEFSDEELKWPGGPESLVTDGECQSFRRASGYSSLRHTATCWRF